MDFFRVISEKNLKLLENFVFDVYITFVQKTFASIRVPTRICLILANVKQDTPIFDILEKLKELDSYSMQCDI